MNGEFFNGVSLDFQDGYASDYGMYETTRTDYGGTDFNPAVSDESFFSGALGKLQSFIPQVKSFSESPVGSTLMQAIYQYGAGKIDVAREKAVSAFLMTSEGKKIQTEATRQTAMQYLPLLVLGGAGLFLLFAMKR
jgi:hypothetical protein